MFVSKCDRTSEWSEKRLVACGMCLMMETELWQLVVCTTDGIEMCHAKVSNRRAADVTGIQIGLLATAQLTTKPTMVFCDVMRGACAVVGITIITKRRDRICISNA